MTFLAGSFYNGFEDHVMTWLINPYIISVFHPMLIQCGAHSQVDGGSNVGNGKNCGNYISGSDMPTNNMDLVDQHCRDISGWKVTQSGYFPARNGLGSIME